VDVDTGSYTFVRGVMRSGMTVSSDAVRPEEMLNYFDYGYAPPSDDGVFAAHIAAAPSPYEDNHLLVRVALKAKEVQRERRPAHLVYLVDVSGSMIRHNKLPLAKTSLKLLTNSLQPGDTVALCTYAGGVALVLPPTTTEHRTQILEAIDRLGVNGGTAMEDGMKLAYDLAKKTLVKGDINRVIVLSDGDANIGATTHEAMLKEIKRYRGEGITLSTVGFGTTGYRDDMMERIADAGDGNYSFVDDEAQARRVFVDGIDGILDVVARDVKLQVSMDSRTVKTYRLIGYENRDVADADFRKDAVDGGEVGAGHSVTAMYDVELEPIALAAARPEWLTLSVRYKPPLGSEKAKEVTFSFGDDQISPTLEDASDNFRFATAVVGVAEILRDNPHAKTWSLDRVADVARTVPESAKDRAELDELITLARAQMHSEG
jgi:Ca-activated chloride channel family protein